jgi:hypothetical protein
MDNIPGISGAVWRPPVGTVGAGNRLVEVMAAPLPSEDVRVRGRSVFDDVQAGLGA